MSGNGSATLDVELIDVGHGDAIVLRWTGEDGSQSNIVIDGGPRSGGALLQKTLAALGAKAVDLMVLTHVDSDHVDGLLKYAESKDCLPVRRYWGPCLKAFERHEWLFPSRIRSGLEKARQLQGALGDCLISSPVEGATWSSSDGGLTVTVLSPAARLLERLLIGEDALELFLHEPTPLGWLLSPAPESDLEENPHHRQLRQALACGEITEAELDFRLPDSGSAIRREAAAGHKEASSSQVDAVAGEAGPEFFGNSVLNDTSIVLLVEAQLGAVRRKLLFTGDLENFAYLVARWPHGIGCDVVKAPHHGSRSFVGDKKEAYDAVWQWLRPRAALVSANGRHGLPRTDFRNAALRYGAALFCTSRRAREIVSGGQSGQCCHSLFACKAGDPVRLTITAQGIEASAAACARGFHSDVMPVIEVRQHVVEPSPILSNMAGNEIRMHTDWAVRWLQDQHQQRVSLNGQSIPGLQAIPLGSLQKAALGARRYAAASDMEMILERAVREGKVWLSRPSRHGDASRFVWAMPRAAEASLINKWIDDFALIQLVVPDGSSAAGPEELLYAADTTWLAQQLAQVHAFPQQMFEQALWPALVSRLLQKRSLAVRRLDDSANGTSPKSLVILTLFTGNDPAAAARKAARRIEAMKAGPAIAEMLHQLMDRTAIPYPRTTPQWPEMLDRLISPLWSEGLKRPSALLAEFRNTGLPDLPGLAPVDYQTVKRWAERYYWSSACGDPLPPELAAKALPALALASMCIVHPGRGSRQ